MSETKRRQVGLGRQFEDLSPDDVTEALEYASTISQSKNRLQILCLLNESAQPIRDLVEQCDSSRTTVKRNIQKLIDVNWVHEDVEEGLYSLSTAGHILVDQFTDFLSNCLFAYDLGCFLEEFGQPMNVNPESLKSCTVIRPRPNDPYNLEERITTDLGNVNRIKILAPALSPTIMNRLVECIAGIDEFELVTNTSSYSRLSMQYPDFTSRLTETEDGELRIYGGDLQYGICITDQHSILLAYNTDDRLHSALEVQKSQKELVSWCQDEYETVRERSEVV